MSHKWILLLVLIILCFSQAKCQDCHFPSANVFRVAETDPAGTKIFNVTSNNRTIVYRYTTSSAWLPMFLNFYLDDTDLHYHMQLSKPVDMEYLYYNLSLVDTTTATFVVDCQATRGYNKEYHIFIQAVSEWAPEFNTSSIQLSVKETLPVDSVVINLTNWASDYDVNPKTREIAMYGTLPYTGDPQVDGLNWLKMDMIYYGVVVVKTALDYDTLPHDKKFVLLGVQVRDQSGKTGTASLTVEIEDDDNKPPEFTYPGCLSPCQVTYNVTVSPKITGQVTGIKPAAIEARDGDTLNYKIMYNLMKGPHDKYIEINNETGQLTILQKLEASGLNTLALIVQAREVSRQARSTGTTLVVTVADETRKEKAQLNIIVGAVTIGILVFVIIILLKAVIVCCFRGETITKKTETPTTL